METPNNNLNILPFYDSVEKQHHRKFYAFEQTFNLISENVRLLPFQIKRDHSAGSTINKLNLLNLETGVSINILAGATSAGLGVLEFASEGYDLLINPSLLILPTTQMPLGKHYLEIGDTVGNTWFSDIFNIVRDTAQYLKLIYWDQDNFIHSDGHIDYSTQYKNYVYLPTEVGKPEYPFEEVAQKRDGHVFIEKQISEKKYKFTFIAPEFLLDALRIVRMHDHIEILSKGETYDVETIIINPKWQDQGDLASVEAEFECDTVIKKIGKSIVSSGGSGDFNTDFNNDFNI
tara:strand:+ start:5212 stop:6081 length:870 start_codon:yes stop_codon:yes gene_type:complete